MMTNCNKELNSLLQEQIAYYRSRAAEYDEWFLRKGRYDRGPEFNRQWFTEVQEVADALSDFDPKGQVLEIACGTGIWTERLINFAEGVTALDASLEMLAINRARVGKARVRYIKADIFSWRPNTTYDVVFFGFWLSHVPPEKFVPFWRLVRSCLAPKGQVFFVDSLYNPRIYRETPIAVDHHEGLESITVNRRLNNGREFKIVKIFYRPEELSVQLSELGWQMEVHSTANYFLYGFG